MEGIIGSAYNDVLTGGMAASVLRGGAGDDMLTGGDGSDMIEGDAGTDTLTGGMGADVFLYRALTDAPIRSQLERITDFSHAQGDVIDLGKIDPDGNAANGDQAFTFIGAAAFTGAGGMNYELREQDNGNGTYTVQADVNHDGTADFAILVASATPLVANDFVL